MGYYYWDPTYILVVIGAVICMIASARVKGTFNKYSQLSVRHEWRTGSSKSASGGRHI